jgi:hypothetical protein
MRKKPGLVSDAPLGGETPLVELASGRVLDISHFV